MAPGLRRETTLVQHCDLAPWLLPQALHLGFPDRLIFLARQPTGQHLRLLEEDRATPLPSRQTIAPSWRERTDVGASLASSQNRLLGPLGLGFGIFGRPASAILLAHLQP